MSAALVKVRRQLAGSLIRAVTVRSGSATWTLAPRAADLRIDARAMVARAVSASREGSIFSRTVRGLFGGSVKRNIPLVVSYSHAAIGALTARVRSSVDRPPRDAMVQPSAITPPTPIKAAPNRLRSVSPGSEKVVM